MQIKSHLDLVALTVLLLASTAASWQEVVRLEQGPSLGGFPLRFVGTLAVVAALVVLGSGRLPRTVIALLGLLAVWLGLEGMSYVGDDSTIHRTRDHRIAALRPPESLFAGLPDYAFVPNYADIDGLRMHYLDVGPPDGEVVLLLHGESTWSYVYRDVVPALVGQGYRVVVPDLLGHGKSDKPLLRRNVSFDRHVRWLTEFVEVLDLWDVTIVLQDWGAPTGLRVLAENQERFARAVACNGFYPEETDMPAIFRLVDAYLDVSPWTPVGWLVQAESAVTLSGAEIAAYDRPYPTNRHTASLRALPGLAWTEAPSASRAARTRTLLRYFDKPFLTFFADDDPYTRGQDARLQAGVPGAVGQRHGVVSARHFLQEDLGPQLSARLVAFMLENPLP